MFTEVQGSEGADRSGVWTGFQGLDSKAACGPKQPDEAGAALSHPVCRGVRPGVR